MGPQAHGGPREARPVRTEPGAEAENVAEKNGNRRVIALRRYALIGRAADARDDGGKIEGGCSPPHVVLN